MDSVSVSLLVEQNWSQITPVTGPDMLLWWYSFKERRAERPLWWCHRIDHSIKLTIHSLSSAYLGLDCGGRKLSKLTQTSFSCFRATLSYSKAFWGQMGCMITPVSGCTPRGFPEPSKRSDQKTSWSLGCMIGEPGESYSTWLDLHSLTSTSSMVEQGLMADIVWKLEWKRIVINQSSVLRSSDTKKSWYNKLLLMQKSSSFTPSPLWMSQLLTLSQSLRGNSFQPLLFLISFFWSLPKSQSYSWGLDHSSTFYLLIKCKKIPQNHKCTVDQIPMSVWSRHSYGKFNDLFVSFSYGTLPNQLRTL